MSTRNGNNLTQRKPPSAATNLIGKEEFLVHGNVMWLKLPIAGGGAGMMEALACHPLGEQHIDLQS